MRESMLVQTKCFQFPPGGCGDGAAIGTQDQDSAGGGRSGGRRGTGCGGESLSEKGGAGRQGFALQRVEREPRRLVTVFGELRIRGPVYVVRRKQKIQPAPVDERLGCRRASSRTCSRTGLSGWWSGTRSPMRRPACTNCWVWTFGVPLIETST